MSITELKARPHRNRTPIKRFPLLMKEGVRGRLHFSFAEPAPSCFQPFQPPPNLPLHKGEEAAQDHSIRRILPILLILLLPFSALFADSTPQRIVSIAPGFTEILYALGVGEHVVGTTNYCDYPPDAARTEKIGDVLNPNIEKIIALKPDIVFCGAWKWKVPEQLRAVGITVVEIRDAEKIRDILDRFEFIGKHIGKSREASELAEHARERLRVIQERHPEKDNRKTVFIEIDSGNWTAGGSSYVTELLSMIGLRNIFDDRQEPYLMVTMESIAARSPDLIITWSRTEDELRALPAWQSVEAVRSGAILDKNDMDWDSIVRQGPRMIDGIEQLEKLVKKML